MIWRIASAWRRLRRAMSRSEWLRRIVGLGWLRIPVMKPAWS